MTPRSGDSGLRSTLGQEGAAFRATARGLGLVFRASRAAAGLYFLLTAVAGLVPAALAWVGKLVVDATVAAVVVIVATAPQMLAAGYHARREFALYHAMAEDTRLGHYIARC